MTLTRRTVLGGGALIAAPGCATTLMPAGPTKAGGNGFTVTLTREWSDLTFLLTPRPRNVRLLSIDGPNLNRLYLASLQPGQSLLRHPDRHTPRPLYRADMSDTELVEFVIDCVAQEYQAPEALALRPQNLGALPGVRFDIRTRTARGLDFSGASLVARNGERLHVLLFLAPSEHYYPALLPEVEGMFASAAVAA